jgi:hypothetical protein
LVQTSFEAGFREGKGKGRRAKRENKKEKFCQNMPNDKNWKASDFG